MARLTGYVYALTDVVEGVTKLGAAASASTVIELVEELGTSAAAVKNDAGHVVLPAR